MTKVAHIIPRLVTGGAERMLFNLLVNSRLSCSSIVITLMDGGSFWKHYEKIGVPIVSLGMKRGRLSLRAMSSVREEIKKFKPNIIQGWLYQGNMAATWSQMTLPNLDLKLFWTVRQTIIAGHRRESILTRLAARMGALLSGKTEAIIYNSKKSLEDHERFGYRKTRSVFIPNGFDSNQFKPADRSKHGLRSELNISQNTIVIGQAGRWDPLYKDPDTLLRAASIFSRKKSDYIFLLAGKGMSQENEQLKEMVEKLAPNVSMLLIGEQSNMPRFYQAIDIFTLASASESFPNVVGEAMASGVPVVVTDTGDCKDIVGDSGIVLPVGDPNSLCDGWLKYSGVGSEGRRTIGKKGRSRIEQYFSIQSACCKFENLYLRECL